MIIKTPTITIDWGSGAVDYSDWCIMASADSPASAVDDRTFGLPHATDHVVGAESITLTLRWNDALMAALASVTDTEGDLVLLPSSASGTYTATVTFSKVPAVPIKIGEKAECDLVLAITDELAWTPAT